MAVRPTPPVPGGRTDADAQSATDHPKLLTSTEQTDRRGRNTFFAAFEAEVLGRGGLHAHVVNGNAQSACEVLTHGFAMGRKLRRLGGNNAIDIKYLVALLAHKSSYHSEEFKRIGILIGRVGIREKLADISAAHTAKQRI